MKKGMNKHVRRAAWLLLLVMLLEAVPFAAFPSLALDGSTDDTPPSVTEEAPTFTDEDYNALYVQNGLVFAWDGFGIAENFNGIAQSWKGEKTFDFDSRYIWEQAGETSAWAKQTGVAAGAYIACGVIDFTSLLPMHKDETSGLTVLDDMTFELVLSNQWESAGQRGHENYTGVIQVAPASAGMLRSWNNQANEEEHPQDETYGPISMCMPGFYTSADPTSDGRNARFFDFGGWQSKPGNYFLGSPMGAVYSIGISHDFTMSTATTGELFVSYWRDANPAIDNQWGGVNSTLTAAYDARYVGNFKRDVDGGYTGKKEEANADTLVLKFGGGKNGVMRFGYHAIRMYNRALMKEEIQLNHLADLFKYYKVDITEFVKKKDEKKLLVAAYFTDYQIGETSKEELEAVLAEALVPTLDELYAPLYARPENLIFRFDASEMTWTGESLAGIPNFVIGGSAIDKRTEQRMKDTIGGGGNGIGTQFWPQDGSVLFGVGNAMVLTKFIPFYEKDGVKLAQDMTLEFNQRYPWEYKTSTDTPSANITHYNGAVNYYGPLGFITLGKVNGNMPGGAGPMVDEITNPFTQWYERLSGRVDNGTNPYMGNYPDKSFYTAIRFDYSEDATNYTRIPFAFSLWRDGSMALEFGSEVYDAKTDYAPLDGNPNIKQQLTYGSTVATQYHSIRIYNCALTEAEMRQNHAVDLMKFYRVDLDLFNALTPKAIEYFYDAVATYQIGETSKEDLEAILINFAVTGGVLGVITPEDFLTFDGVQARIEDYAAMRVRYTVDAEKLALLETLKADVTYGLLYAKKSDYESAEALVLEYNNSIGEFVLTADKAINSIVFRNGEWSTDVSYLKHTKDEVAFGVSLPIAELGSEDFDEKADTEYYVRPYFAACIDGSPFALYLDFNSPIFGDTLSLREVSEYFLCNGFSSADVLASMADENLLIAARAAEALYAQGVASYEKAMALLASTVGAKDGAEYHLNAYNDASTKVVANMALVDAVACGVKLSNARGYMDTFIRLGTKSYASATDIYTALETLLTERRQAAYDALIAAGVSAEEAETVADRVTADLAELALAVGAQIEALADVPERLEGMRNTLSSSTKEAQITSMIRPSSALNLNGMNISRYTIVTDSLHLALAEQMQRFFLANQGAFVGVYLVDNEFTGALYDGSGLNGIYIGMTEGVQTDKDHFSVYFKEDALYIEGENEELLEGGIGAFLRTYAIGKGTIRVTADQLDTEMLNQPFGGLLATLNLPKELVERKTPSFDANGVLAVFRERLTELPDEISIVPLYKPEDFALSAKTTYHVAVDGSDETGNGTAEKPFATLQHAADQLSYKSGGVIYLHGGTYSISQTVAFDERHSGSVLSPTVVTAYGDGDVIFTTAQNIAGADFVPVADADFVPSADKARFDTFTKGNSSKVYAVNLLDHGVTLSQLSSYSVIAQPSVSIGDRTYVTARYPNEGETNAAIGAVAGFVPSTTDQGDIRKVGNVQAGYSSLYDKHKDEDGTWEILFGRAVYKDRLLGYAAPADGKYYMFGSLYEEWDNKNWEFTLHQTSDRQNYMKGTSASFYGVKHTSDNDVYFFGMLEDLDCEGECYVDAKTGILYVYAPSGLSNATVRISLKKDGPIAVDGTKNLVLSGISIERSNGIGIVVKNADHVVIQNMRFHVLTGNTVTITQSRNCGVTHSTMTDCGAITMGGYDSGDGKFNLTRNFVQNNKFLNAGEKGVSGTGMGSVVSHNYFFESTMTGGGFGVIIEYNEFDRGNQFVVDNGPIYTTNGSADTHIRYNYLHDLTVSQYGIYLDDMTSGYYVYGNIVHYAEDAGNSGKAVNLHNGSRNVVMNNLCISTTAPAISNNLNYYPTHINNKYTGGGGLSYRWASQLKDQLQLRFDGYDHDQLQKYYPISYMYHLQVDAAVALMASDPNWTNSYKNTPADDADIFVRTPAMNVYMNNVAVDCPSILAVPKGLYRAEINCESIMQNNHEYETIEEVGFVDAANGNYTLKPDSVIYQNNPDFKPIAFERIGIVES